jgi:alkyl hydroperoxide reductase subunit AhpC
LADFQGSANEFRAASIRLLAASVDGEDQALKFTRELALSYSVGYGLHAETVSEATGAYYDPDRGYLQATGFILRPDAVVAGAVYSTGPIGRYAARDTLQLVASLAKPV